MSLNNFPLINRKLTALLREFGFTNESIDECCTPETTEQNINNLLQNLHSMQRSIYDLTQTIHNRRFLNG